MHLLCFHKPLPTYSSYPDVLIFGSWQAILSYMLVVYIFDSAHPRCSSMVDVPKYLVSISLFNHYSSFYSSFFSCELDVWQNPILGDDVAQHPVKKTPSNGGIYVSLFFLRALQWLPVHCSNPNSLAPSVASPLPSLRSLRPRSATLNLPSNATVSSITPHVRESGSKRGKIENRTYDFFLTNYTESASTWQKICLFVCIPR